MVSRGKDPATPDLGVTAGLGLPLDSAKRGRVYRLPPSKRELGSTVQVPGLDLPKDIAITAAVTQSGRVRVSNLLADPLDWEPGTSLHSSKEWLRFARGVRVPALALRATNRASCTRRSRCRWPPFHGAMAGRACRRLWDRVPQR